MAKWGRPKNVEFWFQRVGLLVGIDVSCLCFVGSEWCVGSAHERCDQAQSHADLRGEQRNSCLPELVFCVQNFLGESQTFSTCSSLPIFFYSCNWVMADVKEAASYLKRWEVFFFWSPTNFHLLDCVIPFRSSFGSFTHAVLISTGHSGICSCWTICQHCTWEFLYHCRPDCTQACWPWRVCRWIFLQNQCIDSVCLFVVCLTSRILGRHFTIAFLLTYSDRSGIWSRHWNGKVF